MEDGFHPGHLAHYESIFALANGYMGVRASLETNTAMADAGFYVAGVFDQVRGFQHEIVNLPCWLGLGVRVDGFPVDLRKGTMLEYRRTLDLRQGILFTHIVWRDAGMHTTRFELGRLVHQTEKHAALQWGTITPLDYSATLAVSHAIDAWAVKYGCCHGTPRLDSIRTQDHGAAGIGLSAATRATGIRVAVAASLAVAGKDRAVERHDDRITECLAVKAARGESIRFAKRVAVYTSRDGEDPEGRAQAALETQIPTRAEDLVASHVKAWERIWADTDIRIEGDARSQLALRFSLFHLSALANPGDDAVSIGAKGLHGNGYCGQVFWDTEIYMLPFYAHTRPEAARSLLRYRHRFLDDARANAQAMRREGAFYPWNSSLTGREDACLGWQEHVGSDIAYGIDWYARATGDREFLHGPGAEIIFETARYWQSRVEPDAAKGYVLTNLMGPDEIHGNISNNCFTNFLVKWHLQRAADLAAELQSDGRWDGLAGRLGLSRADVERWRDISDRMYLPFLPELNIHEQFDGYMKLSERTIDRSVSRMRYTGPVQHSFKKTKVAQQADTVLMYWMFSEAFDADMRRAGYLYYEPRCSHTSSLSRCVYAAVAAQTGLVEEAYRHFLLSAEGDLAPGTEMESESGIHAACMGGNWLAAITGFGGMQVRGDTLAFEPRLPKAWKRLAFQIAWHGANIEVEIVPDAMRLRTRGGELRISAGGSVRTVGPEWSAWLPLAPTEPSEARLAGLGVIFDLDGVLVDTAEHHYQAWQQLANRVGVPFDRSRNDALRGIDRMNSLLLLLGERAVRLTAAEKEALCAEKNAAYVRLIERITPADLQPGARELLESLRSAGALLAVASSSRNARAVLDRLGIEPLLHAIVDGAEVSTAKPAPDLFLLASRRLGVAPERCVVFEDAAAGVGAAKACGMRCVGIGDHRRVGMADAVVPSVAGVSPARIVEWLA